MPSRCTSIFKPVKVDFTFETPPTIFDAFSLDYISAVRLLCIFEGVNWVRCPNSAVSGSLARISGKDWSFPVSIASTIPIPLDTADSDGCADRVYLSLFQLSLVTRWTCVIDDKLHPIYSRELHRIVSKVDGTPVATPPSFTPLGVLWQINAERKEDVQTIIFLASPPLQHRAITGCSSQNTTQLGSDLLTVQFNLNNVNFLGSVNNSRLFFNAQLSILDATEANDQLQSAALFGALASPPPDNALDTLGSALADAQSKLAAFVVSNFTGNTANDTAALAATNDAVAKAIDQAHNLNCTTS
ncbi:hypothetical protein DFH09DRAFT_1087457 [Mycena vulgaris]|nr:hypothetical protein DFH09DRAFT_1087457 [Mycena vulgaris]